MGYFYDHSKDYRRFDFGKEINSWRNPTEEMPEWLRDPFERLDYIRDLRRWRSKELACDKGIASRLGVRQDFEPARQVFEHILELIHPQDLIDFALHKPKTPLDIYLRAAEIFDKRNYDAAVDQLQLESIVEIDYRTFCDLLR